MSVPPSSQQTVNSNTLTWPVPDSAKVTSGFGPRSSGEHKGIDISPKLPRTPGDVIVAAADGTVVRAGESSSYGFVVYINSVIDGKHIQTRYAHMIEGSLKVKVSQEVTAGTPIGKMGNTGRVSPKPTPQNPAAGTHLHFEIRISPDGKPCRINDTPIPVDPIPYLR